MKSQTSSMRILWLDIAKAYGMILVFYGHFVERLAELGNVSAFLQTKFIYSFHMPLFFILSGYIYKSNNLTFSKFIKYHLASRLIPVILFDVLGMTINIIQDINLRQLDPKSYLFGFLFLLQGLPRYDIPAWFLICLLTVETIHYFFSRYIKTNKTLITSMALLFCAGWLITWKIEFVTVVTGVTKNFWFVHESLVAYSFYLFGILLKKLELLESILKSSLWQVSYLVGALLFVLFTFNLNSEPFLPGKAVVNMALSKHGNPLLFPLTAVVGSLFIIVLAKLTPANKIISFSGQNTLILLGMSGFFAHFVNELLAKWMNKFLADSSWGVFLACTLVTLVSMMVCLPGVLLLNKFIPQLVGKPKIKGPIFGNLV